MVISNEEQYSLIYFLHLNYINMYKLILLIAFFISLTSNVSGQKQKKFSIGIDHTFVTRPIELYKYKTLYTGIDEEWHPALWISYTKNNRWAAFIKYHIYKQHMEWNTNYPTPENEIYKTDVLTMREATYFDIGYGVNLRHQIIPIRHIEKLNIWWYAGIRLYPFAHAAYSRISHLITLGWHTTYWSETAWINQQPTFRPMTHLMGQYDVLNWGFVSAGASFSYTGPKINPIIFHLGIGVKF